MSISSVNFLQWISAFDVDLTTQPNQVFTQDAKYIIAGYNWDAVNTANSVSTLTTSSFIQPPLNGVVAVNVLSGTVFNTNDYVYIPGGGEYQIIAIGTTIAIKNLGWKQNAPPGTTIPGNRACTAFPALINRVGLVFKPISVSQYAATIQNTPHIKLAIINAIPSFDPFTDIRAWFYNGINNLSGNFNSAYIALYTAASDTGFTLERGFNNQQVWVETSNFNGTTDIKKGGSYSNNIGVLRTVGGFSRGLTVGHGGIWPNNWANSNSLSTFDQMMWGIGNISNTVIGTPDQWYFIVGAKGQTTTQNISAVITQIKLEYIASNTVSGFPIGPAGGDLSGIYPNPSVSAIQGEAVKQESLGITEDGYVLTWDNVDGYWAAKPSVNSGSPTGPAGGDLSGTYPDPNVVKIVGKPLSEDLAIIGAGQDGYVLTWINTNNDWEATPVTTGSTILNGDITGLTSSNVLTKIRGNPINPTLSIMGVAQDGYTLTWNNGANYWDADPVSTIDQIIFRPGGTTKNNVYADFAFACLACSNLIGVPRTLVFDTSQVSFSYIMPAGTFDHGPNVVWSIYGVLNFANNTSFISVPTQIGSPTSYQAEIDINQAIPLFTNTASGGGYLFNVAGQITINCISGPLTHTLAGNYDIIYAIGGATIGNVGNAVFDIASTGTLELDTEDGTYLSGPLHSGAGTLSFFVYSPGCVISPTTEVPQLVSDAHLLGWVNNGGSSFGFTNVGDFINDIPNIRGKLLDASLSSIGAPEDGYVLTWDNVDTFWTARPQSKNNIVSVVQTISDYSVIPTDDVIAVGAITLNITITLPLSPIIGSVYQIKDSTGIAALHQIIIFGNGNNIDGNASFTLDIPYSCISICWVGSVWSII